MSRKLTPIIRFIALLTAFSFLMPAVKMAGFRMKPDLLFVMGLLVIVLTVDHRVKSMVFFKKLVIIAVCLFLSMMFSGSFGKYYYNDDLGVYFPTEFIQIFGRFACVYCFYVIGYYSVMKINSFLTMYSWIFILALSFGVFQSLRTGLFEDLVLSYASSEMQLHGIESANIRVYGVAGNIIAWGGIGGLCFYYFFFLVENTFMKYMGCLLGLYNISMSASRAAIVALAVSFVAVHVLEVTVIKRNLRSFLRAVMAVMMLMPLIYFGYAFFFPERHELLLMRFDKMDAALNETGRGVQREFYIRLMNSDMMNYFLGIGKPSLDGMGFLEMEPLFLLVAYGIVGFILHYLSLYVMLKESYGLRQVNIGHYKYVLSVCLFFLVFSVGFFFFREIFAGLPFWILWGYLLGHMNGLQRERGYSKMV